MDVGVGAPAEDVGLGPANGVAGGLRQYGEDSEHRPPDVIPPEEPDENEL